jgi:type IV pilus assembly protein PilE
MNVKSFLKKKADAFTLSELLIVMVIVGILILLALPVLMPLVTKAHSMEAKNALGMVQTLQKTYFYEHSKYSTSLEDIGFEQEKLVTESENGKAKYIVEIIEASTVSFLVRATAVVDFDGDGQFNAWEISQDGILREVVKD